MNDIQLTENQDIKGGDKMKSLLNKKILKNNKGFSLVELLIVIAIMGVLAVIAFNMFGGVLVNSKKRADDQQAQNISKAVLTYCVDSNDWKLTQATNLSGGAISLSAKAPTQLIQALMEPVKVDGKEYGPYFSLKDPTQGVSATVNKEAYDPQWSTSKGGEYTGWSITIYTKAQTVKCEPLRGTTESAITIDLAH